MLSSNFVNGRMERGKERKKIKAMYDVTMNSELEKRKKLKAGNAGNRNSTTVSQKVSFGHGGKEHQVGASQGSKRRLSQEEYAEVKRRKKENDRLRKEWPRIFVNEQGKASSLSIENDRVPLFMGDVQSLLFFSALGNRSPTLPRWVSFINVTKVSHVVMVHIEGVGLSDVLRSTNLCSEGSNECEVAEKGRNEVIDLPGENPTLGERQNLASGTRVDTKNTDKNVSSSGGLPDWLKDALPRTSHHMHHSVEIVAPSIHGACPVEELLQMKSEKTTKRVFEDDLKKLENEEVESKKLKPAESFFKFLSSISPNTDAELHPYDKFSRIKLLMKAGELAKNQFPLPLPGYRGSSNAEYVLTSDNYKEVTSRSPMFGLDCEMCLTSVKKLELTSISVVNEKLELVYHTLVLPYNPVVNFLTKFSGITPKMLLNVTKRLEDVQEDLRKLLPPDAILVGHSLESDLSALKMMHPYVIDSSLVYNLSGSRTKRSSLKKLCEIFLDERIQTAGEGGHDPTEDAIASLKLIQFKLKNDEAYGNVMLGWEPPSPSLHSWQECQPDTQEHQQQEPEKDSKRDTKEQQLEQDHKILSEEAIGPFNRNNIYIFQKMESCNIAIVTTALCLKSYLPVLASLNKAPTLEVVSGNKQVSERARDFVASTNLTFVHMEMGKKLSQCSDEATRRLQLTKLDKRLQRIHEAASPKSIHIYVFSGSSVKVPFRERSNGFVLVGIKDLPFRT